MPPTLILIRHAEAHHNATQNWDLLDPALTEEGIQQCEKLQKHLRSSCPLASRVEKIIASPMRRTLQTATFGLEWLIESGVPVEVDAMWQENSDEFCDTGCGLETIAQEFPQLAFDNVDPTYVDKSATSIYAFERGANKARGEACLRSLYERPEKVIAVVSHSAFLRTAVSMRRYANADYRIFTFGKGENGHPELFEDAETSRKGGGRGRSEKGIFPVRDWDFPQGEGEEDEDEE